MEKDSQPDSLTDVTVKQYAPSEVYSSEPPPAYHRPQSTAIQVARIIALTVVAVSVVLGSFILAAAYVQANASCSEFQMEMQLLQEEQRLQQNYQHAPLQPEALTQEEPQEKHHSQHESHSDITSNKIDDDSNLSESSESDDTSSEEEDHTPIHIKLPLQLDFDELAGALMDKNQRSRMNCIVEKKKAEEVIDHQPKTVRLPFGLNLTTDPRYEHVTGERMAIFCESGDEQRQVPQQQEETMMVQPIIVPLGGHMMPFQIPHGAPQQQGRPEQMEAIRAHTIIMEQMPPRQPMHVPVPAQHQVPPQQHPNQIPSQMQHPNPMMHIAQQIVAQHEMALAAARQQQNMQQSHQENAQDGPQMHQIHQIPRGHQMPPLPEALIHRLQQIPEEVLTQINRLPQQEQHVISVSVQEHEAEEIPQEDVRIVQHPRENAHEMNGRQSYARGLPMHIPVPVMQVQQEQQARPHYVQPRSVRSVDNVLHREKRVKRCSCDCAC